MRELSVVVSGSSAHHIRSRTKLSPSPQKFSSTHRPRPSWDALNKEVALRRIKRLASSALALEPFVLTLFDLIETAVPGGTRKAFIADPGDRPDAFIVNYDPQFLAQIVPAFQQFMVDATPQESGMRVKFDPHSLKYGFLTKTVWPLEEFMLPHFYRSAAYNEVIRRLDQRHGAWIVYQENGQTTGFYPFWRDPKQPPLSRDDLAFLRISAPHIAHGLRTAQLLARRSTEHTGTLFSPLEAWGSGIILMDRERRVVAADERARSFFSHLERFDAEVNAAPRTGTLSDALQYIAGVLTCLFRNDDNVPVTSPSPMIQLYSHWSGVVLRLRGILTPGTEGRDYFTVIVEPGELQEQRRRRLRYRWNLSPREAELLTALGDGRQRREIASRMGVAGDTLKSYARHLVDKLDLPNSAALKVFARENFASVS
jgi:DNA-binding CsgD family transcriptional regulator